MKRKILIALLTLGTLGGFAGGAASLACARHRHHAAFEQHVAKLCADAARAESPPPAAR
jgi:hypothetical protein